MEHRNPRTAIRVIKRVVDASQRLQTEKRQGGASTSLDTVEFRPFEEASDWTRNRIATFPNYSMVRGVTHIDVPDVELCIRSRTAIMLD